MAILRIKKSVHFLFLIRRKHSSPFRLIKMEKILEPPISVRGMKVLDKDLLKKNVTVPCLDIDTKLVNKLMKSISPYLLKLPNLKPTVDLNSACPSSNGNFAPNLKRILLNPKLISSYSDFSPALQSTLSEFDVKADNLKHMEVILSYENWRYDELLNAILPENCEKFSSYSMVGHIIQLNLKESLLDYKYIIGQILLDKIPNCKTVINKVDSVTNKFRTFNMEILCGSTDLMTKVKENNCVFEFNFKNVYWNSRLCTEHARIVSKLKRNDVLFDIFAGVGPFAIPAAKVCSRVFANDLNPASYEALKHNIVLNKIKSHLEVFNQNAENFILDVFKEKLLALAQDKKFRESQVHVTMNLPDSAVLFLKYFIGLFTDTELNLLTFTTMPVVHVYCFVKSDSKNIVELAEMLVKNNLNNPESLLFHESFIVRNVSRNKEMIRVSFYLSKNILSKSNCLASKDHGSPPHKKLCKDFPLS